MSDKIHVSLNHSKIHADEYKLIPPLSDNPENTVGAMLEVGQIDIGSWSNLPGGQAPVTQVHMIMRVNGITSPVVIRFNNSQTIDQLIMALERYRDDVWPRGNQV